LCPTCTLRQPGDFHQPESPPRHRSYLRPRSRNCIRKLHPKNETDPWWNRKRHHKAIYGKKRSPGRACVPKRTDKFRLGLTPKTTAWARKIPRCQLSNRASACHTEKRWKPLKKWETNGLKKGVGVLLTFEQEGGRGTAAKDMPA